MPKIKTRKNISSRFKVKNSKKKGVRIIKRTDGQGHFNSKESGKTTRNKRRDNTLTKTGTQKTILRAMPYSN